MKLLVTGSRNASPAMIAYAKSVVAKAKALGWSVIVGDAEGIDAAVISECDRLAVPVSVHGAYSRLRRRTFTGKNYIHAGNYIERDRLMAEKCDVCYAVWDGTSRGTKATYDFAVALGKDAHIQAF